MKCPNCSGPHAAYSKDCPKWIEKNGQRIKAERGISFTEARKIADWFENRVSLGSRTAAAVVSSRSRPTPLTTRCVNVQTDLTWPYGQERPIVVPLLHVTLKHVKQHMPFLLQISRAAVWRTLAPLRSVGLTATPWRSSNIASEYDKGGSKTSLQTSTRQTP